MIHRLRIFKNFHNKTNWSASSGKICPGGRFDRDAHRFSCSEGCGFDSTYRPGSFHRDLIIRTARREKWSMELLVLNCDLHSGNVWKRYHNCQQNSTPVTLRIHNRWLLGPEHANFSPHKKWNNCLRPYRTTAPSERNSSDRRQPTRGEYYPMPDPRVSRAE